MNAPASRLPATAASATDDAMSIAQAGQGPRSRWARLLEWSDGPVLVEQLRLVLGNITGLLIPLTVLALLMVWSLANDDNVVRLSLWATAVIGSKLYSTMRARRILATGFAVRDARAVMWRMLGMRVLDAVIWGALPWLVLDSASLSGGVLVASFLAGIAGASVSMYSPVLPVFVAFILVQITVMVSKLWSMPNPDYQTLGTVSVIYMLTLLMQARNSARATRAGILLRFENRALVGELRIETQKAQAADRAKSKFLAAASHDLRQPLQAQSLFLNVIGRGPLSANQSEALTGAIAATQASASVLNALLDFSRLEAGVIEPDQQPFDVQSLLHKLLGEMAPLAAAKSLAIRVRAVAAIGHSDPMLVELILRNFLANAIRYTERGGVLLACRRRADAIVLEVWDTGIGIEPAQQEEVFREFHQLGNPERDRNKGLGLGLAIAQGLAHLLQLHLSLSSKPGRGSVFRLAVPRASVVAAAAATTGRVMQQEDDARQGFHDFPTALNVLVIDDDATIRSGLLALMREWGCVCVTADSIDAALDICGATRPDFIISDYRLRESRTGAQAIAAIRAVVGRELPALLITGDTAPERLRDALASGIPLLHKPLPPERLYEVMAGLLKTTPRSVTA